MCLPNLLLAAHPCSVMCRLSHSPAQGPSKRELREAEREVKAADRELHREQRAAVREGEREERAAQRAEAAAERAAEREARAADSELSGATQSSTRAEVQAAKAELQRDAELVQLAEEVQVTNPTETSVGVTPGTSSVLPRTVTSSAGPSVATGTTAGPGIAEYDVSSPPTPTKKKGGEQGGRLMCTLQGGVQSTNCRLRAPRCETLRIISAWCCQLAV